MNIKKNETSEAAELKVCVSKLSDWPEGIPGSFLAHTVSMQTHHCIYSIQIRYND